MIIKILITVMIIIIAVIIVRYMYNSAMENMCNITENTLCKIDNVNGVVPNDPYEDTHQKPYDAKVCYTSTMLKPTYSHPPHLNYEITYPTEFYDPKYNPWPRFDDLTY